MAGSEAPLSPASEPAGAEIEAARLAAVRRYDVLAPPPDGAFDRIAAVAARALRVPIATVTIVDEDRIWFKATHGLDGVTDVGRDPGLCSSAIAHDDVHVVPDTLRDPEAMRNPLVTGELGVRFYAGAPITTPDGHRLGTVNVIDTRPREIDDDGRATLADLAGIVMDELELRLSTLRALRRERRVRHRIERSRDEIEAFAATLSRTLVPPELPEVPGLHVASHYQLASARQVGGDFFDLFALPDGRWAVTIGDVCGKGAPAAALTALARYTLRAAAAHDDDPAGWLDELNWALLTEDSGDAHLRFCTAIAGILEPTRTRGEPALRATLATGGHPPAYLVRAHGGIDALRTPGGMLIGAIDEPRITTRAATLHPGDVIVFYTDGLIENRTQDGTRFSDERLRAFLETHPNRGAAGLVDDIRTLLATFDAELDDDVAVMALTLDT